MKVYENGRPYDRERPCAVALGNFDGVHIGHQEILRVMREGAAARGLRGVVWTFDRHPQNVLADCPVTPVITQNELKTRILEELGVDALVYAPFGPELSALSPEDFVRRVLREALDARLVVCGFHYSFASRGAGDASLLQKLCGELGIEVLVVPPVTRDDMVVSSSHIRALIAAGSVDRAALLLTRPFSVSSTVVYGKQLGRQLGFPTVNQTFDVYGAVPAFGVYVTWVSFDGERWPAVTNVGVRPTVSGDGVNAESHILGYKGNLYGKTVEVEYCKRLRPEMRFPSLSALQEQLERDKEAAKRWFDAEKSH